MNGKGDRNRSLTQAYRDGWDKIFEDVPDTELIPNKDEPVRSHMEPLEPYLPEGDQPRN